MRGLTVLLLGLASAATNVSAGTLYAVRDADNWLVKIDSDTLQLTPIGSTGIQAGDFGDLAYDDTSATMYWIAGRSNNNLYKLSLNTGAATLIGSHGVADLFALGWDGKKLYAQSTNRNVYTLSTVNGAPTTIGNNSVYPGGYDYNWKTDKLVFLEAGGGGIYEVSRTNGAATLLNGGGGGVNDNDIAYDWDKNVYWAIDYSGNLFKYDATTYARTTPSSGLGSYAALEYIPEPSALALLAVGALLAGRRR